MNNQLLNAMLGKADVVSGAAIQALQQYLPQPEPQQPRRRVIPNQGNKNNLKIGG